MSNSESAPLKYFYVPNFIQNKALSSFGSKFDQKRYFWDRNLKKPMSSLEFLPLNTSMYRVLFKTKDVQVSELNLSKKGILGTKVRKIKSHTTFLGSMQNHLPNFGS